VINTVVKTDRGQVRGLDLDLPGATVRARRAAVPEDADAVRRLVCHEPRGHADPHDTLGTGFVLR
jgi:proline racemase